MSIDVDGPRYYHTKSDRERQLSYNITYMWNLKKRDSFMNLFTKQRQSHRLGKQNYDYQWGKVGADKLGV